MRTVSVGVSAVLLALASALPAGADVHLVPNANAPLAGRTVVFSPGHGYMRDGSRWRYQRGVVHDLQEDIHTNEIFIEYVQRYLTNAGARVESCRERSFQVHEVIVDSGGPGYTEAGTWSTSTRAAAYYGSGYRYARTSSASTATATFTPTLPESGRYPVYVWYTPSSNRTTDAQFTVHHTGGRTTVRVNQRVMGASWMFLGEFQFAAGRACRVVLSNQGSDLSSYVIADAVRFGGGVGSSGVPRWREGAKAFLAYKGFSSAYGEVSIRPAYATWLAGGDVTRWRDDFLYFALHSNASGGSQTARGLSTFSYSNGRTPSWGSAGAAHYPTNPSPLQAESDRLRDVVHAAVLADVRATFEPSWRDRSTHVMNFGELRGARNMPSALIELGFHDNVDDVALQKSARFRDVAGRAIYKGILRHWLGPNATVLPLPPEGLRLENLGAGALRVSWTGVNDPLEPSAAPVDYKVYRSSDGRGFDDGARVRGTTTTLTGLASGQRVFVRVAALNAGGESLTTGVGGARVGDGPAALVVDGFDRAYTHTHANIEGRYTSDYAVEHLDALEQALPVGAPVDFAANEAVAAGAISLAGYGLVDWLLGREGSQDRTFDTTEQSLVEAYLRAGGALLATGTELGWDLEARGGGQRFFNEVLGAAYVRDDAASRAVRLASGSPFSALGTLLLRDGTQGGYDAATPDVLRPFSSAAGAVTALAWETAGTPGAGVAQSSPYRVVVLGFPLEAVIDPAQRGALTQEMVRFLLPGGLGGATASSGGGSASGGSSANGSANGSATTAAASTASAQTPPPRSGGGGGCSLRAPGLQAPAGSALLVLLALALLVARDSTRQALTTGAHH